MAAQLSKWKLRCQWLKRLRLRRDKAGCCNMQYPSKTHLNSLTTGNAWVRTQYWSYWCLGVKAPGHQYPQCWLYIHLLDRFLPEISHFIRNNIRKLNHLLEKNLPSCLKVKLKYWKASFDLTCFFQMSNHVDFFSQSTAVLCEKSKQNLVTQIDVTDEWGLVLNEFLRYILYCDSSSRIFIRKIAPIWLLHITVTSQWAAWRLKLPATWLFAQSFFSGSHQRKYQSSASLAFVRGIPSQRDGDAENASIWWRHPEYGCLLRPSPNSTLCLDAAKCQINKTPTG